MVRAMLRRLAAGSSTFALVLLLVGPAAPGVAIAAPHTCTGWTSEYVAPPTIRVYRTVGPARGAVQVVPFRQYVTVVLSAEFGAAAPIEALRAGAVAVKDYGWYYTLVWRGHSAPGGHGCYDVVDSTWDQLYWPERYHPSDRDVQAVLDTWPVTVRKNGAFLPTGYRPGVRGTACGKDADGWRLYQASAYRCALDGMLYPAILRTYYGPGFHIVIPGIPDPSGDGLGEIGIAASGPGPAAPEAPPTTPAPDASPSVLPSPGVAAPSPSVDVQAVASAAPSTQASPAQPSSSGAVRPGFYDVVWSQGPQAPWQPPDAPAGTSLDPVTTLGWAFADVNHDGRADVVRLERLGTAGYRITVALSAGRGRFAAAATWWSTFGSGPELSPDAAVQLLAGDFDGDGRAEVAILESAPGAPPMVGADGTTMNPAVVPPARLYVLQPAVDSLGSARVAWTGQLDVSRAQAFAADVTGDGRADLVVASDLFPAGPPAVAPAPGSASASDASVVPVGIRLLVAAARDNGTLSALERWADVTGTTRAETRLAVGDLNRDGRSDVIALEPSGLAGSRMVGLLSDGNRFTPEPLWSSDSFRASAAKIAAADVNGDGRADVVVLYDAGAAGTRLFQFLSTGSSLRPGTRVLDPALDWNQLRPF
jgi:FG-GAP-like repeat/Stage II sporulation protein